MATKAEFILAATDKTKRAFRSFRSSMKSANRSIGGMHTAIAGLVGVGGFGLLIKQSIQAGDQIGKLSQRLGTSTEALSQYRHVAEISGVTFETLTLGWQRMTRRISEAAQGTGEAKGALKELNVSAKELNELAPEQQFEILADAIAQVKNPADRVRLSMKLFDSEGVSLIQTMKDGSQGLREMREEADLLGLTITQENAEAFAQMNDTLTRIKSSLKGTAQSFTLAFGDDFADAVDYIGNTAVPAFRFLAERIGLVELNIDKLTKTEAMARIGVISERLEEINSEIAILHDTNSGGKLALIEEAKALGEQYGKLKAKIDGVKKSINDGNGDGGGDPTSGQGLTDAEIAQAIEDEKTAIYVQGLAARLDAERVAAEEMKQIHDGINAALATGIGNMVADSIVDQKNLADAAGALLKSIVKQVIASYTALAVKRAFFQSQATTASILEARALGLSWATPAALASTATLGGAATAGSTALTLAVGQANTLAATTGGREQGGHVMPTNQYIVAEKNKDEIFAPNVPGSVLPLNKLGSGGDFIVKLTVVQTDGEDQMSFAHRVKGVIEDYRHEQMLSN